MQDATRTRAPYFSADVPLTLKDAKGRNDGVTTSQLTIADSGTVLDIDVRVDISHSEVGELTAVLIAPDGTEVTLFANLGGSGNNLGLDQLGRTDHSHGDRRR